ncbi:MAG TPA: SOS response-associated peptidase family protein, partial [Acidimicrobiia bacterium]
WSTRKVGEQWDRSCSIITTSAEGVIRGIHDRMPVALVPDSWDVWMDREMRDTQTARSLVHMIDADLVMEHQVSKKVHSVRNNGPDLRERVEPETLF